MIIAAGLTPAWQQILRFGEFRPGEVNRAAEVHWCASGKVLNVGIALAHLGAVAETIALVGGTTGEQIEREFASLGIRARWINVSRATRVCTTILDRDSGRTTELVENAGPVTAAEIGRFRQAYAQSAAGAEYVVLSGSLPDGAPDSFYRELLRETPCPAILDSCGPGLTAALDGGPLLVKPNREELSVTLRHELDTDSQLHSAMRELNERSAEWVVVTDGARPAWVSWGGRFFRFMPPAVAAINPIGSGDSLAAAIAWGLSAGETPLDAIRLGIAAGAENAGQLLPGRLGATAVRELADRVTVEPVTV